MTTVVEPLNALETAYLHVERPGAPIHVGAVAVFEGGPLLDAAGELRLDDIRARIAARLPLLPRLRRRLVWPPLDVARPCWVDDDRFDITQHVDAIPLPEPGDDDALRQLAAQLLAVPLDRSRPLWHVRFVTGLAGGHVALVQRVHHSLVDGVSGVDVALATFDFTPDAATVPAAPSPAASTDGRHVPVAAAELAAALAAPRAIARGLAGAARHPFATARRVAELGGALRAELAGGPLLAPRSSLNAPIGDDRMLVWLRLGLDDLRAVGRRHGATVNDVVLAAVAGGVRALLAHRDEPPDEGDVVRVLVPVSLRRAEERGTLGNRVGALLVDLPVGIAAGGDRLRAIAAETARQKASGGAEGTDALVAALDLVPPPVLRRLRPLLDHQPVANLVVTNVPGSPAPLYLLGARMLEAMPFVPLAGNLTLGVAALSYDGTLALGITADRDTCPDVDVFANGVTAAVAELQERALAATA